MTKLSKILKYLAVGAFLLALAVNVKVSLSDPFVTMSEEAIAQVTSDTTSAYRLVNSSETGEKECCKEVMPGVGIKHKVKFIKNTITCEPGGTKPCQPSVEYSYGPLEQLNENCDIPIEAPMEECPGN